MYFLGIHAKINLKIIPFLFSFPAMFASEGQNVTFLHLLFIKRATLTKKHSNKEQN